MRPTHQEAEKLNQLLRVEPTSSLALAVGFPVSAAQSLHNRQPQPALIALLATVRARNKSELLQATIQLQAALRDALPLENTEPKYDPLPVAGALVAQEPTPPPLLPLLPTDSCHDFLAASSPSGSSGSNDFGCEPSGRSTPAMTLEM